MTINTDTRHPNGHDTHRSTGIAEVKCPYCGSDISGNALRELQARAAAEERARAAKTEAELKARVAREMAKAEARKKAEIAKATREATATAEKKLKLIRDNQEATIAARLSAQREAAEKKLAEAVNTEKVKAFEEKTRLTEQLAEMQRRLEKKTAHEIGAPAEINLYECLTENLANTADKVSRFAPGVRGPDVLVEVVHRQRVVGKIVLDSKNHARWQNAFTKKLRQDQIAENADFGILSTSTFPKGARQLHIQDGVIVADPARVVVLVHLLRRQIIENHILKLSSEARNEKAEKLYAFFISPACTDIFDRLQKVGDDLINLEAKEVDAHHGVWRKRGELIRTVQRVHEEFAEAVSRIIGGAAIGGAEAAQ